MFTKQWIAHSAAKLKSFTGVLSLPANTFRNVNGYFVTGILTGQDSNRWSPQNINVNYFIGDITTGGIKFGTGTTSPTTSDYSIESLIPNVSNSNSVDDGYLDSNGNFVVTYTNTITNTTQSSITITEAGLYLNFYIGASSSSIATWMVWRDVLETPVVLAPNQTKTIETVLTFPCPTA